MSDINSLFMNGVPEGTTQIVSVMDIRRNPKNFFRTHSEEEELLIQQEAEKQLHEPQIIALVGYEDYQEDGKRLTLLSGEKRWRAALFNYENGRGKELIRLQVVPKPKNDDEELKLIIGFNNQTNFSKDIISEAIRKMYNIISKEHPEYSPTKLSEYIAPFVGVSDRQVRNYFRELKLGNFANERSVIEQSADEAFAEEQQRMEDEKRRTEWCERVGNEIKERIDTDTKVKANKKDVITITMTSSIDDMYYLLEVLHLDDVLIDDYLKH